MAAAALGDLGSLRYPGAGIALALGVLAYLASQSHYSQRVPFWTELRAIVFVAMAALLCSGCIAFMAGQDGSRVLPFATWILFPFTVLGARTLARRCLAAAGLWQIRTVLVADPDSARQTLAALKTERALGYSVVAVISPGASGRTPPMRRWRGLMAQYNAGLLLLSYDSGNPPARDAVESLVRERVPFAMMPQLGGLPVLGFEQTRFFSHDTVMFTYRNNLAQPMPRLTKLVFDWLMALAGVVCLAPILLLVALLVKLDGGPALFGHTRIGAGGRPFRCLKFRSMVVDGDAVLRRLLASDPDAAAEWARTNKLRDDPRITRVGRILRSRSLDEIPQLFNVLRLEMSLVGPRPIVASEVARYGDDITYYYEARPGLTGLWQVSGRSGTSYDRRVQLDTWYVKNWTLWHDIAIISKTIPAVLKRRGAF